jgi:hypothetical protein
MADFRYTSICSFGYQILEGYGSQLAHLTKEVQQIQKEFAEWEESITTTTGVRHKIEA